MKTYNNKEKNHQKRRTKLSSGQQPGQSAGQPEQLNGQPGQPNELLEQPGQSDGQLEQSDGQLEQSDGQLGQPDELPGQPEQLPEPPMPLRGHALAEARRRRTVALLAAGAAVCAVVTGILLVDYHRTAAETEKALEALRLEGQAVLKEVPGSVVADVISGETLAALEVPGRENPYGTVFREYPDIKGWLQVEGTAIDYPVLQREGEDEYYLYRNFEGEEDKRGSLILDEDSSVQDGDFTTNILIHGHNMKDGSMFGELEEYRSEDYYREHKYMKLYTEEGRHDYEVIAVFQSQVFYVTDQVFKYYNFFQADTPEEFHYFYDNIKGLSLYDTGVEARYGDKFLTLSTCAYHVEDGRFVVVAKETD